MSILQFFRQLFLNQQEKPVNQPIVVEGEACNHTEDSKKLKFVYLRSEFDSNKVVTIGYLWIPATKTVYYQVARCAKGDRFIKAIGRAIVRGRYAKYGPSHTLHYINKSEDIIENFLSLWHPDEDIDAVFALENK